MNPSAPKISYSLPEEGGAVEISLANEVPGGWSVLYNRSTTLTQFGQIANTIGEFSTGTFANINVSRLVNMSGNPMTVKVPGGCMADMERCVYARNTGTDSCGDARTYNLLGCKGSGARAPTLCRASTLMGTLPVVVRVGTTEGTLVSF